MKRNIKVERLNQRPLEQQEIELVERKGIGHPDSVADGLAESISRALCQEYINRFGAVLHHNTDKTQIVAGRSKPAFGGGEVICPLYILLTGRATRVFKEEEIPVDTIAIKAARQLLADSLSNLDVNNHIILDAKIGMGSSDLRDVFGRKVPSANDTSFGVGYAPLSQTEKIVFETERELMNLKKSIPAIGEDIKVMGMRQGDAINLTIACALVDRHVANLKEYADTKREIVEHVIDFARQFTSRKVSAQMNVADNIEEGSIYITVTGSSAEMGDDGAVGRGNRANGLITPNRPMSLEATCGKNPINHVGKIYNLLSIEAAKQIAAEVQGIEEVYIKILSQIGKPIDEPHIASVQIVPKEGVDIKSLQAGATEILDDWLANIPKLQQMLFRGELSTY
ncbi:MAG TPA: methionine adenosyltransferase [Methanothrix sp.]|uniref:methionine adenosyltransferase n=1 Tax=Methanothrix sp. TaxID=90426 RepID=UPI002CE0316D|nr:methionine adenosyltransferase [Methanothrix sp.]MDI9416769.1 methionine adenosyltransferase [Euryarchaeota archaeon]HON35739.1 methionine adenosyltransferase [Methanothrix sp.]HRU76561.1 methionine adenosyltransferase [Methanothrix sp.]